jgi:hypothetical protein
VIHDIRRDCWREKLGEEGVCELQCCCKAGLNDSMEVRGEREEDEGILDRCWHHNGNSNQMDQ